MYVCELGITCSGCLGITYSCGSPVRVNCLLHLNVIIIRHNEPWLNGKCAESGFSSAVLLGIEFVFDDSIISGAGDYASVGSLRI